MGRNNIKAIFLFIVLLIIFIFPSCNELWSFLSQESLGSFNEFYGGGGDEVLVKVLFLDDGSFFLVGYTNSSDIGSSTNQGGYDIYLVHTDGEGQVIKQGMIGWTGDDIVYDAILLKNNTLLLVGSTTSDVFGTADGTELLLINLTLTGEIIWYSGAGVQADIQAGLALACNNEFIFILGISYSSPEYVNSLWKFSMNGAYITENQFYIKSAYYKAKIIIDSNSTLLLIADSYDSNVPGYHGTTDILVMRTDLDGNEIDAIALGDTNLELFGDAFLDSKRNIHILGSMYNGANANDIYSVILDSSMTIVKETLYGSGGYDDGIAFSREKDGSYWMICTTDAPGTFTDFLTGDTFNENGTQGIYLIKFNSSNQIIANTLLSSDSGDYPVTLYHPNPYEYVLFGYNSGAFGLDADLYGGYDYFMLAVDENLEIDY